MPEIFINGKPIRYKCEGSGNNIVLIHGFLETLDIWDSFAYRLSESYRVTRFDIPGHGLSDPFPDIETMEILAKNTMEICNRLKIIKPFIIGHSMGGYIALAIGESFAKDISGLCLFHSTPFADSNEKIVNRQHDMKMIQEGKLSVIAQNHFSRLLHPEYICHNANVIEKLNADAKMHKPEGISAAIKGMMLRCDRSFVLNSGLPVLVIGGRGDVFIPVEVLKKLAGEFPSVQLEILEKSGHAGFIEETDTSVEIVRRFLNQVFQQEIT